MFDDHQPISFLEQCTGNLTISDRSGVPDFVYHKPLVSYIINADSALIQLQFKHIIESMPTQTKGRKSNGSFLFIVARLKRSIIRS